MRYVSETRRNRLTIAVETPWPAVLNYLQARFVMAKEQLVGNAPDGPLYVNSNASDPNHCTPTTLTNWSGKMPRPAPVVEVLRDASSFVAVPLASRIHKAKEFLQDRVSLSFVSNKYSFSYIHSRLPNIPRSR